MYDIYHENVPGKLTFPGCVSTKDHTYYSVENSPKNHTRPSTFSMLRIYVDFILPRVFSPKYDQNHKRKIATYDFIHHI